ncbi:TetR family transcriptional regulator [Oerskovia turbata]|uniref:TetR family transcriptional regulator n=1 Tax=Oerskovia turbata TaxID=1713 RepID=A0A4Q1KQ71_9CELL|nr:TetR/AcrR family transcriptional regulator [Oerskovia turbata]RXR22039.1 TetR family transcriptional regulator [Oerskovia turbata]RXR32002.1 TetR family transcriptional regulator [Oerskovia turbata]TGJ96889.1 TetR family transcriptional regulator [Actinotalea fermentans ATCC 43279 = JCM 9966 = DSM 3133]
MSETRRRALDAAVELVGNGGVRALTHGRVDAAAGIPPGSTSNHFRTRAALVAGVIEWIADGERQDGGAPEGIRTAEDLTRMLVEMIEVQSGPLAARTRARYALFLDATDTDALAPLLRQRAIFEDWIRRLLVGIGGAGADAGTLLLMASCDGLLLHRITVDPDAPVVASVTTAVETALRPRAG